MLESMARVTSRGATAPGTRTAPITASTSELLEDAVGVGHQAPHRPFEPSSRYRRRSSERSRTVTSAPRPRATRAA